MQFDRMKASLLAGWVLIVAVVAVSLNIASASGWLLLIGVGLLPPMILFLLWRQPAQTMSESIRDVLK